jgi:hypothetical protein
LILIEECIGERIGMTAERQQMIQHISDLIRKPGLVIDENTALVSSSLVDSMALVDPLLKLEEVHAHAHTTRESAAGRSEHRSADVRDSTASGKASQIEKGSRHDVES